MAAWAVVALLAVLLGPIRCGEDLPKVWLDSQLPSAQALQLAYTEKGMPVRLATDNILIQHPAGEKIESAVVKIANPLDAPLELLVVNDTLLPPAATPLLHDYDPHAGELRFRYRDTLLSLADVTEYEAQFGAAVAEQSLRDFEAALAAVTYEHAGLRMDVTSRAITFVVKDVQGAESIPGAVILSLSQLNDPPVLDLNGPNAPGLTIHTVYDESERSLSISIVDSVALEITDVDSDLLQGAEIKIIGALETYATGNVNNPTYLTVEEVTVNTTGTSIRQRLTNGTLTLTGNDSLENYQRVMRSARYRNPGLMVGELLTAQSPTAGDKGHQLFDTRALQFTPGIRTLRFSLSDVQGAKTTVEGNLTVVASERAGDSRRDPSMPAPAFCSGNGRRNKNALTGFKFGPDFPDDYCICNDGYLGDNCEFPPCMNNGEFTVTEVPGFRCNCYPGWEDSNRFDSIDECNLECSGNGKYVGTAPNGYCDCNPRWADGSCSTRCDEPCLHGQCTLYPDGSVEVAEGLISYCQCDPLWLGPACDIPCPCSSTHGNGTCALLEDGVTAVCECEATGGWGYGWGGPDCSLPCPPCEAGKGSCEPPDGWSPGDPPVNGTCRCITDQVNGRNGMGWTGADCSISCRPCVHGTCAFDGRCTCKEGWALGSDFNCALECNGHGVIVYPVENATLSYDDINATAYQGLVNPHSYNALFDMTELFGIRDPLTNLSIGYCKCNFQRDDLTGGLVDILELQPEAPEWTGPWCDIPCPACQRDENLQKNGECVWDGTNSSRCLCYEDKINGLNTDTEWVSIYGGPQLVGVKGQGYSGDLCEFPCLPCFNGTCSKVVAHQGACLCDPGYAGANCIVECGASEFVPLWDPILATNERELFPGWDPEALAGAGGIRIGNRGRIEEILVSERNEIEGLPIIDKFDGSITQSNLKCVCHDGWTGPMCSHRCPFDFDKEHGKCVLREDRPDTSSARVEDPPWQTEIVCDEGWTGTTPQVDEIRDTLLSPRNCSIPCDPCVHGQCLDNGQCLCEYGYIWQPPLSNLLELGSDVSLGGTAPYIGLGEFGEPGAIEYNATLHDCSVPHPCSMNGEYLNATCGANAQGTVKNGTAWNGDTFKWQEGSTFTAGFGCTTGELVNGTLCVDGVFLMGMPYHSWQAGVHPNSVPLNSRPRAAIDRFADNFWGLILGGECVLDPWEWVDGLPITNGVCICDNIQNGRFAHPSALSLPGERYDYYFQGWAGEKCDIPCKPCSEHGACDLETGECRCHAGWSGYRCSTPCEPCVHGTCQYDGSCLCNGERRLREGSFALRLPRDPFYLEKGRHEYEVGGERRSEYVHPAYMDAATVEDFLWEVEYECQHREECVYRTFDSHLTVRPNETYFRWTTPVAGARAEASRVIEEIDQQINELKRMVEEVPHSLNNTRVGVDTSRREITLGTTVLCDAACMARFSDPDLAWGRNMSSCGPTWGDESNPKDGARPWHCDNMIKAHFVREANLQIGRLRSQRVRWIESFTQEERWLELNLNERQALLNRYLRGFYNGTSGQWEPYASRIDVPNYFYMWVTQQLIYGVTSGGGYAGWDCSIPCQDCDPVHGTCQYDGSCECETGWYGERCDVPCDCFRHICGVDNSTERTEMGTCDFTDLKTSTIEGSEISYTVAGFPVQAHGTCQRDGSCRCNRDQDGIPWTGVDCFTKCDPCSYGDCQNDGSCLCQPGWTGPDCATRNVTECLPCDFDHGTCLTDGTCKCDKGWTGLDCSLECRPCLMGDCQMDGSCFCRPGWTLPDCSKHLGPVLIRSDFAEGDDGWRSYNNSYACEDGVNKVQGVDRDELILAFSDRCQNNYTDGGGVHYDEHMKHIYMSDRLPYDRGGHELMYFRAPPKFLGDQMGIYNHTLAYQLHTVPTERSSGGVPHADTSADVILVGGLPTYNGTMPDLVTSDKFTIFDWSRAQFPELPLNARWTKGRVVSVVKQYMATPQVFLAISTDRVASDPDSVGVRDTPVSCRHDECVTNFNFDFVEGAGWTNIGIIPAGFGWSHGNPWVNVRDNTVYVGGTQGFGGTGHNAGTTYFHSTPGATKNPFPQGQANYGSPVGNNLALLAKYTPILEEHRAMRTDSKSLTPERLASVDPAVYLRLLEQAMAAREALAIELQVPVDSLPLTPPEAPLSAPSPGAITGGGLEAKPFFPSIDFWNGDRLHWDLLPEVHRAIELKRGQRYGHNATLEELLWALGSVQELLIRADYETEVNSESQPTGRGELVRMNEVAYVERDPFDGQSQVWQRREQEAYMRYLQVYGERYEVAFLREYFGIFAEELRLSICSGNGVWADGMEFGACVCQEGWVGVQCDVPCPPCFFGTCNLTAVFTEFNVTNATGNYVWNVTEDVPLCLCQDGFVGPACDLPCPPCSMNSTCVASDIADGPMRAICDCPDGRTGEICDVPCPPCNFAGGECVLSGREDYPSKCECDSAHAGLLCELNCPASGCGNGRCEDRWEGQVYELVTDYAPTQTVEDVFCVCNSGWAGTTCTSPCPGTPSHPNVNGSVACSGRGTCFTQSAEAVCECSQCSQCDTFQISVRGTAEQEDCCILESEEQSLRFFGEACEEIWTFQGSCGNGLINAGETCDDGGLASGDGCDSDCQVERGFVQTDDGPAEYNCENVPIPDILPPRPEWNLAQPQLGFRSVCILVLEDSSLRRRRRALLEDDGPGRWGPADVPGPQGRGAWGDVWVESEEVHGGGGGEGEEAEGEWDPYASF